MSLNPAPAKLVLIDAGGTIAASPNAQGALEAGGAGLVLADGFPERRQAYSGLSEDMTLADMARVRDAVLAALAEPEVAGVIVAHGTDALEETAFLTDLALGAGHKPVVFTGAMLPMAAGGSDGPDNLALAMARAADPAMAGRGALVCFAGQVIPAALAYKHSTSALAAFGWRQQEAETLPRAKPLPAALPSGKVALVALAGGDDGALVEAAAAGHDALVLMALGRGNASGGVRAAVARAVARGVFVAIASRCPVGGTAGDYATGSALETAGGVFAGGLGPSQCRILLAQLLACGADHAAMASELRARGTALARD